MGRVIFRPLRDGDIEALLAGLRAADLAEIYASTDDAPDDAVVRSVRDSDVVLACDIDGRLAALFGVASLSVLPSIGAPWLLGTAWLDENPRALMRASPGYIQSMLCSYQHLLNFIDARNTRSIRWLRRLGFTIHPAEPYGPHGFPFHRFDMRM